MLKVAVAGGTGRMGKHLIQIIAQTPQIQLSAVTARAESSLIGADAGEVAGVGKIGVVIIPADRLAQQEFDLLIDFTQPELTMSHLPVCLAKGAALVVGTTGLTAAEVTQLKDAATQVPVVLGANMSVGVNVAYKLLEMAARAMKGDYDVEIVEAHHRYKKDAPSGTALAMGEVVAKELELSLDEHAVYGREGFTGERPDAEIGFATVRGGDVVGDHTVMFLGDGDRLEITHKASSRMTFAKGAIRAALWLQGKPAGWYSMAQVLGLEADS